MSSDSFNFDNFISNKQNLEANINKFKSFNENYDAIIDPSFVLINNIDLTLFVSNGSVSKNDCKAICSTDESCIAYAFVDGSCNKYTSIDMSFNSGSDNVFIKKNQNNLISIGKYLKNTNETIYEIASIIKTEMHNYDNSSLYYYDEENNQNENLDASFNVLNESQNKYRNLIASHENNINPIVVNTYYFRYIFLFVLMFIMFVIFIYFSINSSVNNGSNFMFYLVLFVVILSVLIVYILK